jgi:hypothetical protein
MSNNVLYFPSIRVPGSDWFTRMMLLYWDIVGTIMPAEFMERPGELGEDTRGLLEAELLTPVIPGMHLYKIPSFDESFAEYLENLGPEIDHRKGRFLEGETTEVHVEKVGALEGVMRSFGLCRGCNDPGYSRWYFVERETAADFMAYLAASLGKLEELSYNPITDKERYCLPLMGGIQRPVERQSELTSLRSEVLEDCLPAPKRPISVRQLQEFKRVRGGGLARFRRAVERELIAAAAISDPKLRRQRLALFREEVEEQVQEIAAHLAESGFGDVVFTKLCPVIAAIPGVSFVFGLAGAVYSAFRKSPKDETPSPLAYAAYAQLELLGRTPS